MFGAIAQHYDLLNWVMTLGQDQRWRRQAAEVAELRPGDTALDVATGTGDLALELWSRVAPSGRVIGIDVAEPMLELARNKVSRRGESISFEVGNGLATGFEDDVFKAVSCGFGIRNMQDREAALREWVRITRRGGRVVILELTPPTNILARSYMSHVVPRLGQWLAEAREAYTYLPESVQDFPDAAALGRMMQLAGLARVKYRLLNFGTVALHWGMKA